MNPGNLRHKLEVHVKQEIENELEEVDYDYIPLKNVWGQIMPRGNRLGNGEAETEYVDTTHKIRFRTKSLPGIDNTYRIKYKNEMYEVLYVDQDYKNGDFIEVHVKSRTE